MEAPKTDKDITTNTIGVPVSAPRTKPWDPKDMITTGNIERIQRTNAAAEAPAQEAEPAKTERRVSGKGKKARSED